MRNRPPTRSVCAYLWNNFISVGHARHGWNVAPEESYKSQAWRKHAICIAPFRFPSPLFFQLPPLAARRVGLPVHAGKGNGPRPWRIEFLFSFVIIILRLLILFSTVVKQCRICILVKICFFVTHVKIINVIILVVDIFIFHFYQRYVGGWCISKLEIKCYWNFAIFSWFFFFFNGKY